MKFCDNLLVEADVFYQFRSVILCNAKHLQFHQILKKKNVGAQFSKYSIPLCCPFFIYGVVGFVCVAHFFSHCDSSIVIFCGYWLKIVFHRKYSCIIFLIKKK